jgi:uncharacterized protein (TIGR00251 family)
MKIFVKAKTRANMAKIEKISENSFVVAVSEPPEEGRANAAIVKSLAEYFHTAPSRVRIMAGHSNRQKIIEIT